MVVNKGKGHIGATTSDRSHAALFLMHAFDTHSPCLYPQHAHVTRSCTSDLLRVTTSTLIVHRPLGPGQGALVNETSELGIGSFCASFPCWARMSRACWPELTVSKIATFRGQHRKRVYCTYGEKQEPLKRVFNACCQHTQPLPITAARSNGMLVHKCSAVRHHRRPDCELTPGSCGG